MIEVEGITSFGRVGHYERKGLYSIKEVLSRVLDLNPKIVDFDGDIMNMHSSRYVLFKTKVTCVRCGVIGQYFAKERAVYWDRKHDRYWPTTLAFHFNLYGITQTGKEVMLTKDHVIPKSRGGSEEQINFQTMCGPCNSRKKDRMPDETDEEYSARRALEKKRDKARARPYSAEGPGIKPVYGEANE